MNEVTDDYYSLSITDVLNTTKSNNQSDVCRKVLPSQISSLTFSFVGAIGLIYIIVILCCGEFKNSYIGGCKSN